MRFVFKTFVSVVFIVAATQYGNVLAILLVPAIVLIGTALGRYRGADWPGCPTTAASERLSEAKSGTLLLIHAAARSRQVQSLNRGFASGILIAW